MFQTKKTAIEKGCVFHSIKKANIENCILGEFDGHDFIITIYDSNTDGEFIRTNQLIITSWYQKAKIGYEDLLGNGVKFIRVESEGNTGTGYSQTILSYWGWHDNKFVPIFFETISYVISDKYYEDLNMNYNFINKGTKQVSLVLAYQYFNDSLKHKYDYTWKEELNWHDSFFSFYDQKREEDKLLKTNDFIYKKIINARLNFIKTRYNMQIIDTDLLNKIEIMNILYDEAY
jgi:hypothetical protein